MMTPEFRARANIDLALEAAGWAVQDRGAVNLSAAQGIAVREFPLQRGHGAADYLLFVDAQAVGVVEAKPEGDTLTGVEVQTEKYSLGLPANLDTPVRPLPFLYQSTGVETRFTNGLDPEPRSRGVFSLHCRPRSLPGSTRILPPRRQPRDPPAWPTNSPPIRPMCRGRPAAVSTPCRRSSTVTCGRCSARLSSTLSGRWPRTAAAPSSR